MPSLSVIELTRPVRDDVTARSAEPPDGGAEFDSASCLSGGHCYPPVESVARALEILREVNRQGISTVRSLHAATGQNKSTIVRMLETLMVEGYVVADALSGGYRVTRRVLELTSGYDSVSRVIEAVRPLAIDLTRRFNWPVGLGLKADDDIVLRLYTGAISPWAYSNAVLKQRPSLTGSAMGRAYLAFCEEEEREELLERLRMKCPATFGTEAETSLRRMLGEIRSTGFAIRDPRTEPRRMTSIAMPIRDRDKVIALMACSFFKTVIGEHDIFEKAAKPLANVVAQAEAVISGQREEAEVPREEGGGKDPVAHCERKTCNTVEEF